MKIFVDIDTLTDFFGGGALEVPGADAIRPVLKGLTKFAKETGTPIIKFNDEHDGTEPEMSCNGGPFPLHCLKDTEGAMGIIETATKKATIFPKQCYDVFDKTLGNKNIVDWLKNKKVTDSYVYGLCGNICIEAAVVGLLKLGINVNVFGNAVVWMDLDQGIFCEGTDNKEQSIKRMRKAGAHFAKAGV